MYVFFFSALPLDKHDSYYRYNQARFWWFFKHMVSIMTSLAKCKDNKHNESCTLFGVKLCLNFILCFIIMFIHLFIKYKWLFTNFRILMFLGCWATIIVPCSCLDSFHVNRHNHISYHNHISRLWTPFCKHTTSFPNFHCL